MQISKFILSGFFCVFVGCATTLQAPNQSQPNNTVPVPNSIQKEGVTKHTSTAAKNNLDDERDEEKKRALKQILEKAEQISIQLEKGNTSIDAQEVELDKRLYSQLLEIAEKKQESVVQAVEQKCSDYSEKPACPITYSDDCPITYSDDCPTNCSECPEPAVKSKKCKKCPTCFSRARIGKTGKDKLIVVSLSTKLSGQANNIQESFIQVFSELKTTIPSFTLLTVQAGSKLNYPLLTHSDVQRLPIDGSHSIRSKIEDAFQFGASDLRALRDLGVVDGIVTNNVGRILYITDNVRLGTDKPSNNQRGIPLAWAKDGIRLAVLTTQGCKVWRDYTGAAACTSWHGKEDLVRELKAFLR